MTEEELQRIRERAEKAAPGPWRVEDGLGLLGITSDAVPFVLGSFHPRQRDEAEFVAYAREDIPTLLAEVEQLREIAQAVADGVVMTVYDSGRDVYVCSGCEREVDGFFTDEELAGESVYEHVQPFIVHKPTCIVLKTRQLLGK